MTRHRSFRLTIALSDDSATQAVLSVGKRYIQAITTAIVQQAAMLLLAAMILDGGVLFRFFSVVAIASWVVTLVIVLRRPKQPTKLDIALITYGFWYTMPLVVVIGFVEALAAGYWQAAS